MVAAVIQVEYKCLQPKQSLLQCAKMYNRITIVLEVNN